MLRIGTALCLAATAIAPLARAAVDPVPYNVSIPDTSPMIGYTPNPLINYLASNYSGDVSGPFNFEGGPASTTWNVSYANWPWSAYEQNVAGLGESTHSTTVVGAAAWVDFVGSAAYWYGQGGGTVDILVDDEPIRNANADPKTGLLAMATFEHGYHNVTIIVKSGTVRVTDVTMTYGLLVPDLKAAQVAAANPSVFNYTEAYSNGTNIEYRIAAPVECFPYKENWVTGWVVCGGAGTQPQSQPRIGTQYRYGRASVHLGKGNVFMVLNGTASWDHNAYKVQLTPPGPGQRDDGYSYSGQMPWCTPQAIMYMSALDPEQDYTFAVTKMDSNNYTWFDVSTVTIWTANGKSASLAVAAASHSSKPPLGPIVGGSVGGAVFLALVGLAIFLLVRRRRKRSENEHTHHDGNTTPAETRGLDPNGHAGYSTPGAQSTLESGGFYSISTWPQPSQPMQVDYQGNNYQHNPQQSITSYPGMWDEESEVPRFTTSTPTTMTTEYVHGNRHEPGIHYEPINPNVTRSANSPQHNGSSSASSPTLSHSTMDMETLASLPDISRPSEYSRRSEYSRGSEFGHRRGGSLASRTGTFVSRAGTFGPPPQSDGASIVSDVESGSAIISRAHRRPAPGQTPSVSYTVRQESDSGHVLVVPPVYDPNWNQSPSRTSSLPAYPHPSPDAPLPQSSSMSPPPLANPISEKDSFSTNLPAVLEPCYTPSPTPSITRRSRPPLPPLPTSPISPTGPAPTTPLPPVPTPPTPRTPASSIMKRSQGSRASLDKYNEAEVEQPVQDTQQPQPIQLNEKQPISQGESQPIPQDESQPIQQDESESLQQEEGQSIQQGDNQPIKQDENQPIQQSDKPHSVNEPEQAKEIKQAEQAPT